MIRRIRFVGGALHNELLVVPIHEGYCYRGAHRYQLAEFRTARGTLYLQYVHASLLRPDGTPRAAAHYEPAFPPL
jgi:hypothetical protein